MIKKDTRMTAIALLLLLIFLPPNQYVRAAIDESRSCALDLRLQAKYGSETYMMSGVEIGIFQVAEVTSISSKGKLSWQYTSQFSESPIRFGSIEKENVTPGGDTVEALINYANEKKISGTRIVTNEVGCADFENLPFGLYLVVQTTKNKDNKEMIPFLVPLPFPMTETDWEYSLTIYPKIWGEDVPPAIGSGVEASGSVLSQVWGLPRTGLQIIPIIILLCLGFGLLTVGGRLVLKKGEETDESENQVCEDKKKA